MIADLCNILRNAKTIAVLGISDKPERDSGSIALFLKSKGYQVIGVHPIIKHVEDIPVVSSIKELPNTVDILDIFLNGDRLYALANDIIRLQPKVVWFQLGVHNDNVRDRLRDTGIEVIENHCIAVSYRNCSQT
jgi:predicted CoA-binding protein